MGVGADLLVEPDPDCGENLQLARHLRQERRRIQFPPESDDQGLQRLRLSGLRGLVRGAGGSVLGGPAGAGSVGQLSIDKVDAQPSKVS